MIARSGPARKIGWMPFCLRCGGLWNKNLMYTGLNSRFPPHFILSNRLTGEGLMDDVKSTYIDLGAIGSIAGYVPLDYRPVWRGDVLVGFEVFYYPLVQALAVE